MKDFRILCTTSGHPTSHQHVTGVGISTNLLGASEHRTVAQVIEAIQRGDRFYTYARGQTALVESYCCSCGYQTLRTGPEALAHGLGRIRECTHSTMPKDPASTGCVVDVDGMEPVDRRRAGWAAVVARVRQTTSAS